MDHYENPRNKRTVNDARYLKTRMNSESCIDDFEIQVLIENNIIRDFCFDGIGCTISTASTSILSELVIGKTTQEALEIIQNYENMIHEESFQPDLLEEANVFKDVSKQANRIKCATIGFHGLKELIGGANNGK